MNRRKIETVKEILQRLITDKKKIGNFVQTEIEDAIIDTLDCVDKRTVQAWFSFLWRKEYFVSPAPHKFSINLEKVSQLEVKMPIEIDPLQKRLGEF